MRKLRGKAEKRRASGARQRRGRLFLPLCLFSSSFLGSSGCAYFWDDVTSRDFQVKTLFVKPEPMEVLAKSTDGDYRARALRALKEPKQNGGSDADQDTVLDVVIKSAISDTRPLCRLAAIETLGRFKDPRATQALIDSYYAVTEQRADSGERLISAAQRPALMNTFAPDIATQIQCQALRSLGETGNPLAVELLTAVAREPKTEGQNKQQVMDMRITATRALGRFQQYQATETLVHVMATEKDVALRDAAHESLQTATGKKLPPDSKEWEQLLHQSGDKTASGNQSGLLRTGLLNRSPQ